MAGQCGPQTSSMRSQIWGLLNPKTTGGASRVLGPKQFASKTSGAAGGSSIGERPAGVERLGIVLEGLFHLEIAAGRADDFSHEIKLKELKAIPKSASLADNGASGHATEGDSKVQLHDLIECNFHTQDGGNTRFADVDGIALESTRGTGIDRDVGADFEARLSARVDYFADSAGLGMFLKVQLFLAFRKTYSECTADGDPRPC